MGVCEFKTGRIITADPLCYLQNPKEVLVKAKRIKAGTYPIQLSVMDSSMACFCDEQSAQSYWRFLEGWYMEHKDGNIYDDYFAELFAQSYQKNPDVHRECGDFLMWSNPLEGSRISMFASGMGDGYYTDYWGIDASGEIFK